MSLILSELRLFHREARFGDGLGRSDRVRGGRAWKPGALARSSRREPEISTPDNLLPVKELIAER
jgi:hypothetical protein